MNESIANLLEIPRGRHFAILKATEQSGAFMYFAYTDHAEYQKTLERAIEVCGTGNVTGLSVVSKAEFQVAVTA